MYGNLVNVAYHQFVKVDDSMDNLQARVCPETKHRGEPVASIGDRRRQLPHYGDLRRLLSAICNRIKFAAYSQDDLTTGGVRNNRHASLRLIPIVVSHLQPLNPCNMRSLMSKLNLDIMADVQAFAAIKGCTGGSRVQKKEPRSCIGKTRFRREYEPLIRVYLNHQGKKVSSK